jgi:hypothetical protein
MTSHNLPRLTFARSRFTTGEALTQTHRLDLNAQPVTRIMTITIEEIIDDGSMTLRLGDPPVPVPEPFATLVRSPSDRPARPAAGCSPAAARPALNYTSLSQGLRDLGVPLRLARVDRFRSCRHSVVAPRGSSLAFLKVACATEEPPPQAVIRVRRGAPRTGRCSLRQSEPQIPRGAGRG